MIGLYSHPPFPSVGGDLSLIIWLFLRSLLLLCPSASVLSEEDWHLGVIDQNMISADLLQISGIYSINGGGENSLRSRKFAEVLSHQLESGDTTLAHRILVKRSSDTFEWQICASVIETMVARVALTKDCLSQLYLSTVLCEDSKIGQKLHKTFYSPESLRGCSFRFGKLRPRQVPSFVLGKSTTFDSSAEILPGPEGLGCSHRFLGSSAYHCGRAAL